MGERRLSAGSTVREWLADPVGGELLRALLARAGRSETALAPVRHLPLDRLAALSGGRLPREAVEELVRRTEAADETALPGTPAAAPGPGPSAAPPPAPDDPEPDTRAAAPWVERTTPGRFAGATVVVTGAASGIGRAVAARIAAEGGRVVAVDLAEERLRAAVAALPGAVAVPGDIRDEAAVLRIVEAAGERIDGLANVAGVMDDMTPLHEVSDAVWSRVMGVNVEGAVRLSRAVLPRMLRAARGSIVNVASEAGLRGSAAGLAYTTSKHAVVGMTRSAAFMYGPSGIRVNAVAPGPVATGIDAAFGSALGQERIGAAMAVMPPIAEPAQLAASIAWLLSDDATNVNGAILPSDGGWSVA